MYVLLQKNKDSGPVGAGERRGKKKKTNGTGGGSHPRIGTTGSAVIR